MIKGDNDEETGKGSDNDNEWNKDNSNCSDDIVDNDIIRVVITYQVIGLKNEYILLILIITLMTTTMIIMI